jgi:hypothetical protein
MSEGFRPGSVAEKKEKQAQARIGWKLEKTLVIVGAWAREASRVFGFGLTETEFDARIL